MLSVPFLLLGEAALCSPGESNGWRLSLEVYLGASLCVHHPRQPRFPCSPGKRGLAFSFHAVHTPRSNGGSETPCFSLCLSFQFFSLLQGPPCHEVPAIRLRCRLTLFTVIHRSRRSPLPRPRTQRMSLVHGLYRQHFTLSRPPAPPPSCTILGNFNTLWL